MSQACRVVVCLLLLAVCAYGSLVCPPKLHYFVEEGALLSNSLVSPVPPSITGTFNNVLFYTVPSTQVGVQGTCGTGNTMKWSLITSPAHHTKTPTGYTPIVGDFIITNGAFAYANIPDAMPGSNVVWNGYDSFRYKVECVDGDNAVVEYCTGVAFINVVFTSASSRNANIGHKNADFTTDYSEFVHCSGSCLSADNGMKWFARQTLPRLWDIMTTESGATVQPTISWGTEGEKQTDGLEFKWSANYATVITYGAIGNMGVRFPTMEEVTFTPGNKFTTADYTGSGPLAVHADSTGYDRTCLSEQSENLSEGDGYKLWMSCTNPLGCVGPLYKTVLSVIPSWYSKFNGKHSACDVFQSYNMRCSFAPLLTPRMSVDSDYNTRGVWKVTVDNCLIKWEGRFIWDALMTQVLSNGNKAWGLDTTGNKYTLSTTIYNEAVQPNSWTDPSRGFAWIDTKYHLTIILKQDVDFQFELGIDIFTVDLQHFTYSAEGGDHAFGYNMIIYPLTLNSGFPSQSGFPEANYPDRRINGFVWVSQYWYAPKFTDCPTCPTGGFVLPGEEQTKKCTASATSNGAYTAADMPEAFCVAEGNAPLINLIKGPATGGLCGSTPENAMTSITEVRGVSAQNPQNGVCATNYQNITLRGISTNSHTSTSAQSAFGFEGTIVLEFLLINGEHPHFQITPKMYVQSISIEGGFAGTSYTCRGSPYWPVPASVGIDLPQYLCEENDARTFGPTDWAIIFFDITDVQASHVELKSVYIMLNSLSVVFEDVVTPTNVNWITGGFGYFHYRNLKSLNAPLLAAPTHPAGTATPPQNTDFGFAFTPGAHNENVKITIYCTLKIKTSGTTTRRFGAQAASQGENQLQQSIQITKSATSSSFAGVSNVDVSPSAASASNASSSNIAVIVLAVACGLLIVAVIGMAVFIMKGPAATPKRVNSTA